MKRTEIEEGVFISGQPSERDLQQLPEDGIKSVINLRTERGARQAFPRFEERKVLEDRGLRYVHLPVSPEQIDDDTADSFRDYLQSVPRPVLVHSRDSQRAAALALMDRAVREGWDSERLFGRARNMGVELQGSGIERSIVDYVDGRREGE